MSNPELSRVVEMQIGEILEDAYPSNERFLKCQALIQRTKDTLFETVEFYDAVMDSFFSENPSKVSFYLANEGIGYQISYYRKKGEENLTLVKEDFEKVNLHTYQYEDGRVHSTITYSESDDGENFSEPYLDPASNEKKAYKMISELEHYKE